MNMSNIRTKVELALQGKCVRVFSKEEAITVSDFILDVLFSRDNDRYNKERGLIHDKLDRLYTSKDTVKFMVVNTIYDMRCITFLLECTGDRDYSAPFKEDYGTGFPCAFTYTHNVDADFCSEMGDSFFEKQVDGYYHRVS